MHLLTTTSASKTPQLVEQVLGMVEVGQRGGEIAAGVRRYCAFLARVRVLQVLAARGVQRLGPGVVPVGPLDVTQGESTPWPGSAGHALPRPGRLRRTAGRRRPGRPAEPRRCGPGPTRRRPCGSGSGQQGRRGCRCSTVSRTDKPRRVCPARSQATPRLARTSDSRSRSPALRANRRAFLNSSIASLISPKSRRTTPAAWCATAACDADGCWASTSRAAARASDGRDSARASSLSGSQATGAPCGLTDTRQIVFNAPVFRRVQLT